MESSNFFRTVN